MHNEFRFGSSSFVCYLSYIISFLWTTTDVPDLLSCAYQWQVYFYFLTIWHLLPIYILPTVHLLSELYPFSFNPIASSVLLLHLFYPPHIMLHLPQLLKHITV